jgi:hypothetical protein
MAVAQDNNEATVDESGCGNAGHIGMGLNLGDVGRRRERDIAVAPL